MSTPISATMTSAVRRSTPGIVQSRASSGENGATIWATSPLNRWIASSRESRWANSSATSSRWWRATRPSRASRNAGSLLRRLPRARSARTSGSVVPPTSASSIARPETPSTSEATQPSSGPGILQHLVQPLGLAGALIDQCLAVAGQLPQLPDRAGRHEARADQTMPDQLGDPGRVGHIGHWSTLAWTKAAEVFVVRLGEGWGVGQRRSPLEGQQDTAALRPPEGFRPAIEARAPSASQ
jgi:hypothetical protein